MAEELDWFKINAMGRRVEMRNSRIQSGFGTGGCKNQQPIAILSGIVNLQTWRE